MPKPSHARPLSPHLQVYRMGLPATLSILHRLTGMVLYGGCVLWAMVLVGMCLGSSAAVYAILHTPLGYVVSMAWVGALYYHLLNGIRHLFWDVGKGFELSQAYLSGWLVVGFTLLLTAGTWGWLLAV